MILHKWFCINEWNDLWDFNKPPTLLRFRVDLHSLSIQISGERCQISPTEFTFSYKGSAFNDHLDFVSPIFFFEHILTSGFFVGFAMEISICCHVGKVLLRFWCLFAAPNFYHFCGDFVEAWALILRVLLFVEKLLLFLVDEKLWETSKSVAQKHLC